jgi:hypothetical protein
MDFQFIMHLAIVLVCLLGSHASASLDFSSQYWTAFLNVSYADPGRKVWHTERTETGRFSSSGVKEAYGLAVEIVSSLSDSGGGAQLANRFGLHTAEKSGDGYDRSGCSPPFRKNYPTKGEPWIAVIRRGRCTFNEKIANALLLNASGVLIYDDEDGGGNLQTMKVERRFPIPSVFTYHWKGNEILNLMRKIDRVYLALEEGSHCRTSASSNGKNNTAPRMLFCTPHDARYADDLAHILRKAASAASAAGEKGDRGATPPGSASSGGTGFAPFWNINLTSAGAGGPDSFNVEKRTSVLFVSVSFIILMIISLAWLVFYYVQRFRYIHAKDQLERKLCSQAKRALSIISTSVLKKDDIEMRDFSETCAVCIETYRVAEVVRILPCKHQFHKGCIDQWLLEKRTCPMCKMDILKHYGMTVEDAESSSGEGDEVTVTAAARRQRRRERQERRQRMQQPRAAAAVAGEEDDEDREDAVISLA